MNDTFGFKISTEQKPLTLRGLLSTLSSVYDPLGLAAPFLLEGRKIIQKLCKENSAWDDPIQEDPKDKWTTWMSKLQKLEGIKIPGCFKPSIFGQVRCKHSSFFRYF